MLELDHPMTAHRFAAARADDRLLTLARHMTLTSTQERQQIFEACRQPLDELRRLNDEHFGAFAFTVEAVTELEQALNMLAEMETSPRDGTAYAIVSCPVCGALLTHAHAPYMPEPERRWSVYCSACLKPSSPARRKLDSSEGFGTWAI